MKGSVKERVLQRLQGFAEALQKGERLGKKFTIRQIEFDLNPTQYTPGMVKEVRQILGASQAVFAKFLGVSLRTVNLWEQGAKPPRDIACRFMDEIKAKPEFWKGRLLAMARVRNSGQLSGASGRRKAKTTDH